MQLGVSQLCATKTCRIQITSFYENSGDHCHLCHCKTWLTLLQPVQPHQDKTDVLGWELLHRQIRELCLLWQCYCLLSVISAQSAHLDEGKNWYFSWSINKYIFWMCTQIKERCYCSYRLYFYNLAIPGQEQYLLQMRLQQVSTLLCAIMNEAD